MNNPQTESWRTIDTWLRIATKDLCASAKERITLEIQTHYQEAVTAHLTEGATLVKAQENALDELGNAKKAARRFRRKHLTIDDEANLIRKEMLMRKRPSDVYLLYGILMIPGALLILINHSNKDSIMDFSLACVVLSFLLRWVFYLLIRAKSVKSAIHRVLFFEPIDVFVSSAILPLILFWLCHSTFISLGIYITFTGVYAFSWVRLLQKAQTDKLV